jgi:tetratricopeptide (TPR) repeat protein
MRMPSFSIFAFALLLVAGVPVVSAGPQAPDDGCLTDSVCRARYNQAVALFEAGRFETALPEFNAAYERRQMPWLLINIGRTLHRLGRPREALDYYERYKKAESRPDAETLERLERYITQARALSESTPAVPVVEAPKPPVKEETPLYKKWWFWTAIGGGVALVVIIGAAAGTASRGPSGLPGDGSIMIYNPTF